MSEPAPDNMRPSKGIALAIALGCLAWAAVLLWILTGGQP